MCRKEHIFIYISLSPSHVSTLLSTFSLSLFISHSFSFTSHGNFDRWLQSDNINLLANCIWLWPDATRLDSTRRSARIVRCADWPAEQNDRQAGGWFGKGDEEVEAGKRRRTVGRRLSNINDVVGAKQKRSEVGHELWQLKWETRNEKRETGNEKNFLLRLLRSWDDNATHR